MTQTPDGSGRPAPPASGGAAAAALATPPDGEAVMDDPRTGQPAGRPPQSAVRWAAAGDLDVATRLLVAAYTPTPLAAWLVPDPALRTRLLHRWLALHVRSVLAPGAIGAAGPVAGRIDLLDQPPAVAVWRRTYASVAASSRLSVAWRLRLAAEAGTSHARRFAALDTAAARLAAILPAPGAVLAFLATHPRCRQPGAASSLLTGHHRHLDRYRLPAAALAPDPAAIALLATHGYRRCGPPIQLGGPGGRLQPMLRPPGATRRKPRQQRHQAPPRPDRAGPATHQRPAHDPPVTVGKGHASD